MQRRTVFTEEHISPFQLHLLAYIHRNVLWLFKKKILFDSAHFWIRCATCKVVLFVLLKKFSKCLGKNKEILLMNTATIKNTRGSWVAFWRQESLQFIIHSLRKTALMFTQPSRNTKMVGNYTLSIPILWLSFPQACLQHLPCVPLLILKTFYFLWLHEKTNDPIWKFGAGSVKLHHLMKFKQLCYSEFQSAQKHSVKDFTEILTRRLKIILSVELTLHTSCIATKFTVKGSFQKSCFNT